MIGDAIAAALPLQRSFAESLMNESARIERRADVWSEAAQETVTTWTLIAEVPCYTSEDGGAARVLLTDQASTPSNPFVHAPWTLSGVEPDDRVTHSSGAVLWVTDVPMDPYPVEAKMRCRWSK